MPMTQLVLVFLASLASFATVLAGWMVMNAPRVDRWTRAVVTLGGAILWGIVGISSFDVVVTSHVNPPVSEPILPMAYVGIALSMLIGLYGLYDLLVGIGEEARNTADDLV